MKYLSGIFALNLPNELETDGDWHQSALNWAVVDERLKESSESVFGLYGIEPNKVIPEHDKTYNVANHIRACLDLIAEGNFSAAQGMRENFINNESYTREIFDHLLLLQHQDNWERISHFMYQEYPIVWRKYLEKENAYELARKA